MRPHQPTSQPDPDLFLLQCLAMYCKIVRGGGGVKFRELINVGMLELDDELFDVNSKLLLLTVVGSSC